MKFTVVQLGSMAAGNRKYIVKERQTKSNIVLDIGLLLEFKDKQRAEVVADMLNHEFGSKR